MPDFDQTSPSLAYAVVDNESSGFGPWLCTLVGVLAVLFAAVKLGVETLNAAIRFGMTQSRVAYLPLEPIDRALTAATLLSEIAIGAAGALLIRGRSRVALPALRYSTLMLTAILVVGLLRGIYVFIGRDWSIGGSDQSYVVRMAFDGINRALVPAFLCVITYGPSGRALQR